MQPSSLRLLLAPSPLVASCVIAGVLVVHPTQPGAFPNIQAACNAAAERDTILVKSGTYPGFDVGDRWLTIAEDAGAGVSVVGGVRIHDLQAGMRLTLIGLSVTGSHVGVTSRGIDAHTNDGAIRIFDCSVNGAHYSAPGQDGSDALSAVACADIAISRSELQGGIGGLGDVYSPTEPPGRGGAGLSASQSSVVLHDSNSRGGIGTSSNSLTWPEGGNGGHGAVLGTSSLFASRSTFAGGQGGNGYQGTFSDGSDGGDGLSFAGGSQPARLVSVTATGAMGGHGRGLFPYLHTTNGVPFVGGPFIDLGPIGRSMAIQTNPIRENTSATFTLTGQPGDRVGLFVSSGASSVFNAGWNGQQLFPLSPSPTFIDVGVLPAGGVLTYSLPFPDLGPGVSARTSLIQPAFSSATVRLVLGTPVPLLVLDSAY